MWLSRGSFRPSICDGGISAGCSTKTTEKRDRLFQRYQNDTADIQVHVHSGATRLHIYGRTPVLDVDLADRPLSVGGDTKMNEVKCSRDVREYHLYLFDGV